MDNARADRAGRAIGAYLRRRTAPERNTVASSQNLDPGFYDDATVFRSGAMRRRK